MSEINFTISSMETCLAAVAFMFLKEPAEEAGNVLKDFVSECRRRLSEVFEKRRQIRLARELVAGRERIVSSKFMLSWFQGAMFEDDEELQKLWAALLVNAEDRDFKREMRVSYTEILKSLTSLDALVLSEISNGCFISVAHISEKAGTSSAEVEISLDNLKRLRLVDSIRSVAQIQGETHDRSDIGKIQEATITFGVPLAGEGKPKLTSLGRVFVDACTGWHIVGSDGV